MIRILFVCLGNICRSPMAEAVMRDLVAKNKLSDKIEVDSAGTADWHTGKVPHKGTRAKLDEYDISYDHMTARQIKQADFTDFQYIIVMDEQNLYDLKKSYELNKHVVVQKLLDNVKGTHEENVPDPYYTGDFQYTYELVSNACEQLLQQIMIKHQLN
ncbi:MAG TPA: low molecular weight protein-tyrosine-phosphatase [Pseudogracilibacillus sp.]|nr:low molecular weight protein-tyrosine-phosphatase [Pseudogracilibacillus sp.]